MKLTTIAQAKNKGIFRDGDEVDLTEIIQTDREKFFVLLSKESGCYYQRIMSKTLKWFYCWNPFACKPLLIGLPDKECKVELTGKDGFINGSEILDRIVNYLYANNEIKIYGRQFTQEDYYGLTKKEIDEITPFEKKMFEIKDVEKIFTATPVVKSYLGKYSNNHYVRYGFMKIDLNNFSLKEPDKDNEYLYSTIPSRKEQQITWKEETNTISAPLFPILYGNIDDLLVDISNISNGNEPWKLSPPKQNP